MSQENDLEDQLNVVGDWGDQYIEFLKPKMLPFEKLLDKLQLSDWRDQTIGFLNMAGLSDDFIAQAIELKDNEYRALLLHCVLFDYELYQDWARAEVAKRKKVIVHEPAELSWGDSSNSG